MNNDPYQILGVPYWADDDEIKKAFQEKALSSPESKGFTEAYGKIRDTKSRAYLRWNTIETCISSPKSNTPSTPINIPSLIKELAFCTDWELGDDTCLMN